MPPAKSIDLAGPNRPNAEQPLFGRLQQEVEFWREMLAAPQTDRQSRESVERMKQALALAEYRLAAQARITRDC